MTTYTNKFVMAEVMVPNVRQDSIHITIEIHSDVPIEKTTDIDHVSYEQATKSVIKFDTKMMMNTECNI